MVAAVVAVVAVVVAVFAAVNVVVAAVAVVAVVVFCKREATLGDSDDAHPERKSVLIHQCRLNARCQIAGELVMLLRYIVLA